MDFFDNNIAPHIGTFLSAILTGIAGFLFGRKKMKAETTGLEVENEGKEIENTDKLVKLYKEALDDLSGRYEQKFLQVSALHDDRIKLLEEEIKMYKRIIANLKIENTALKKKNGITP